MNGLLRALATATNAQMPMNAALAATASLQAADQNALLAMQMSNQPSDASNGSTVHPGHPSAAAAMGQLPAMVADLAGHNVMEGGWLWADSVGNAGLPSAPSCVTTGAVVTPCHE